MPMGMAMAVVRVKSHIRDGHKVKSHTRNAGNFSVKEAAKQFYKTGSTGNKNLDKAVNYGIGKAVEKIHPQAKMLMKLYKGAEKTGAMAARAKITYDEKRRKKK